MKRLVWDSFELPEPQQVIAVTARPDTEQTSPGRRQFENQHWGGVRKSSGSAFQARGRVSKALLALGPNFHRRSSSPSFFTSVSRRRKYSRNRIRQLRGDAMPGRGMSDRAIFTLQASTFSFNNRPELLLPDKWSWSCCFKLNFETVSLATDGRKIQAGTFVL